MHKEIFFADRSALMTELLAVCGEQLQRAVDIRGRASLLVSGGATPQPLYQQLSQLALNWAQIDVALVDERWVEADQPGSNEAFIRDNLLINHAAQAAFTGMKNAAATAQSGQALCEANYQKIARPFNVAVLGMGLDGHTASLFPAAQGLERALSLDGSSLCAAIKAKPSEVTGALTERMSLTLNALLQTEQLYLLITGQEKRAVYRQALAVNKPLSMPIAALLHQQQTPVSVYWAP